MEEKQLGLEVVLECGMLCYKQQLNLHVTMSTLRNVRLFSEYSPRILMQVHLQCILRKSLP